MVKRPEMDNSMTAISIVHQILLKVAVLLKRIKAAGLNGPICAHFIQEHTQKKDYKKCQPTLACCVHSYISRWCQINKCFMSHCSQIKQ